MWKRDITTKLVDSHVAQKANHRRLMSMADKDTAAVLECNHIASQAIMVNLVSMIGKIK